jgi:chromosome segregation protein
MYLKEIQMENFKSFGRKTVVPFYTGYTCITGPNGSGKSNISDAILFVLGPKSSKAVRASKLTDLIFNGGPAKKPSKYTRVTLVFDNASRIIPVDTNEVELTRVVKISPTNPEGYYSYFYVNGKSSSLNEFDTLLAHARISAEGYNLVQQGDVTRIVNMGNIDRRRVLDGIAGITQYDEDINKAEIKRKEVEDNLEKIDTLLSEVKKRTRQLSKDREDAVKYKDIKDKSDTAKVQMAYKKKDSLEEQIVSGRDLVKKYEEEQRDLEDTLTSQKKKYLDLSKKLEDLDKRMGELKGDEAKSTKDRIDELRLNVFKANDGIEKAKFNIKQLKDKKGALTNDLRKATKELDGLKAVVVKLEGEIASKKDDLKIKEDALKELEEGVTKTDSKALAVQREILLKKKELETAENERHGQLLEKDRAEEKLERLTVEIAQMEETLKKVDFEIKDIDYQLGELGKDEKETTKKYHSINEAYTDRRTRLEKLLKESRTLEESVIKLKRDYELKKATSQAQESVQKGYSQAVEAILEARDKGVLKGIHGTIAELGNVKKEYEDALGIAAGPRMQAVVVDDDETAAKAITMLRQKNIGRGIFLPLNKMVMGRPCGKAIMAVRDPNAIGLALDLVQFKEDYKAAFWFVFGDTVVLKDLTTARKLMGGVRLVTLEGDLCEKTGAMVGGTVSTDTMKFGVVKQSDIDKIAKELQKTMERADKVSAEIKSLRAEMDRLEGDLKAATPDGSDASRKIGDLDFRKKDFSARREALKKDLAAMAKDKDATDQIVGKLNRRVTELEATIGSLTKEREDKNKALLKATPMELQKKLKDLRDGINELAEELREMTTAHDTDKAKIEFMEQRVHELEAEVQSATKELSDNEEAVVKFKESAVKSDNELKTLQSVSAKADTEYNDVISERDKAFKDKTTLDAQVEKVQSELETKDDLILQQKDRTRALEEQLTEQMNEVTALNIKVTGALPSLADLEATIKVCEKEMQALEPVNMKALEDYESEDKRRSEMEDEISRLKDQRAQLIKVVEELNGKKKTGLMKVFIAINKNFKKVFSQLSLGGEAELFLENPDSPFEGGLIIKARPKGKKVLRLEALSGGEKSMTALALIFAIQEYQPSPFYLLDEVDMFLDAVNAEAVAHMIKENTRNVQFLQITLRKATLDHSDHFYGVTINKDGISQVIANLNLQDIGKDGTIKISPGAKVLPQADVAEEEPGKAPTKTIRETTEAETAEEEEEEEDE